MKHPYMHLKILQPFGLFLDRSDVKRIVVETYQGGYGLLPNRLDGVAAVEPGIFTYESEQEGTVYLAVDQGILIKTEAEVLVSVRKVIGGKPLGQLHQAIEEEFLKVDDREKDVRAVLAKLEVGFMRQFQKLQEP